MASLRPLTASLTLGDASFAEGKQSWTTVVSPIFRKAFPDLAE